MTIVCDYTEVHGAQYTDKKKFVSAGKVMARCGKTFDPLQMRLPIGERPVSSNLREVSCPDCIAKMSPLQQAHVAKHTSSQPQEMK